MARGDIPVEVTRKHLVGLKKILKYFETQACLAEALSLSRQAINHWFQGRIVIPEKHAYRLVDMVQGRVTISELRPDLAKTKKNDKKYLRL